jgi:predicted HicB family RNase H-like nuclease
MTLRFPKDVAADLRVAAAKADMSMQRFAINCIAECSRKKLAETGERSQQEPSS